MQQVQAQTAITQAFSAQAPKAIGDFSDKKRDELIAQAINDPMHRTDLLADAAKWDEGGIYRTALHTLTGALVGEVSGALGAGAVATAATQLKQLQDVATTTLIEQGIDPSKAQTMAQGLAQLTALAIGTAVSGAAGGTQALVVDTNNRQLHLDEKTRIKQLAAGDAIKEARLTAAACALVKCYAEYPEGSTLYVQLKRYADLGATDALAGERQLLSKQTGMFAYSSNGIFNDVNIDAAKRLNNTYQIGTRTIGLGETVLGGSGLAVSVITAPAFCATGVGCVATALGGTLSLDAMYAGAKQTINGKSESTFLNQGLQGLGMSQQAAG